LVLSGLIFLIASRFSTSRWGILAYGSLARHQDVITGHQGGPDDVEEMLNTGLSRHKKW
jgi:hypothetical protein